jgi:hypothetical protein
MAFPGIENPNKHTFDWNVTCSIHHCRLSSFFSETENVQSKQIYFFLRNGVCFNLKQSKNLCTTKTKSRPSVNHIKLNKLQVIVLTCKLECLSLVFRPSVIFACEVKACSSGAPESESSLHFRPLLG